MDQKFRENFAVPELQDVPIPRKQAKQDASPIPDCLRLSENVKSVMIQHFSNVGLDCHHFDYSVKQQQKALELFANLHLHVPNQEDEERDVQSKYAIQKTKSNTISGRSGSSGPNKDRYRRITRIYQCQCGVDNTTGRHASKTRQIPWKNVDCTSWIKLTTIHDEHRDRILLGIDEISGIFDHSDPCIEQIEMDRNPRIPLSADLREFALELLRKNTPLSLLRSECATWAEIKFPGVLGNNSCRYRLTTHDTSSLYRSISRERGIHQRSAAEDNLDKWFRAQKPQPPSPVLTQSCLYYQAHEKPKTDRFEIILSTPEMREAAWRYGHKKQVLMDLTFGVCSARALLAILMALDKNGTGIPICFIMFTARETAKATHADYDTALLDRLLGIFKAQMGTNAKGEDFTISVGNTDNDIRERDSLTSNWPNIFLILCTFHIWQAWKNMLNRRLQPVPKGDQRQLVRKRLGKLLMDLLKEITDHGEAQTRLTDEIKHWEMIGRKRDPASKCQASAAINFLAYIKGYVENQAYWISWSPAGAAEAARQLGIPISRVARTTNPLESFNGRIKGKYYKPYQHSGRLPRIDTWIILLVTAVMPDFFKERHQKKELQDYYASKRVLPGSEINSNFTLGDPSYSAATSSSCSSNSSDGYDHHTGSMIEKWFEDLNNSDGEDLTEHSDQSEGNIFSEHEIDELDCSDDDQADQSKELEAVDHDHYTPIPNLASCIPANAVTLDQNKGKKKLDPVSIPRYSRRHLNFSSEEIIPDSDEESAGDIDSNGADRAFDESGIIADLDREDFSSRAGHSSSFNYRRLIVVPPSPTTENRPSHITAIATAMMEIQAAEDRMLKSIQTVLQLSPESKPQLEKYISPSICARMNSPSSQSLNYQIPSAHLDDDIQSGSGNIADGLVPFLRNRKEARKPSYGIR